MYTRVRETEGGYKVSIFGGDEPVERTTPDLKEAFALQAHAQKHGAFPEGKEE